MAGLELSSHKERRLSDEARYGRIELKKFGITVLVQYYVCCSNIPCVRVLGYIRNGHAARVYCGQEIVDELQMSSDLIRIPEAHKGVIRQCVMADTAARFSIDAPLVHFNQ